MAVDHWTSADVQPFDTQVDQDDSSVRYVLAVSADQPFGLKRASATPWAGPPRTLHGNAEASLRTGQPRDLRRERGPLP